MFIKSSALSKWKNCCLCRQLLPRVCLQISFISQVDGEMTPCEHSKLFWRGVLCERGAPACHGAKPRLFEIWNLQLKHIMACLLCLPRSLFSQVGSIRHTYDLWQWQSEIGNSNGLNPFKPCHQSNPSHPPTGRYILLRRLSLLCTGSNIAHLLKRIL